MFTLIFIRIHYGIDVVLDTGIEYIKKPYLTICPLSVLTCERVGGQYNEVHIQCRGSRRAFLNCLGKSRELGAVFLKNRNLSGGQGRRALKVGVSVIVFLLFAFFKYHC